MRNIFDRLGTACRQILPVGLLAVLSGEILSGIIDRGVNVLIVVDRVIDSLFFFRIGYIKNEFIKTDIPSFCYKIISISRMIKLYFIFVCSRH